MMRELQIVILLVGAAALVAALSLLSWETAAYLGSALIAAGHLFGLPAALRYHLLLRRELVRTNRLARGWFWRPNLHHNQLRDPQRSQILWWWYAGGAGFVLVVVGLLVIAAGLLSALRSI